jgi:hypothetical protein
VLYNLATGSVFTVFLSITRLITKHAKTKFYFPRSPWLLTINDPFPIQFDDIFLYPMQWEKNVWDKNLGFIIVSLSQPLDLPQDITKQHRSIVQIDVGGIHAKVNYYITSISCLLITVSIPSCDQQNFQTLDQIILNVVFQRPFVIKPSKLRGL